MQYTKKSIFIILVLISIIAAIFSFKAEYAKHQAMISKYQHIDTSRYKMLTAPEIFEAVGKDQWELGYLIKDGKIIKPMKEYKPRMDVQETSFSLIMNCGVVFSGSTDNQRDELNGGEININEQGYLQISFSPIPYSLVMCPNESAYELGNKVFIPALDSKMAIYKVDEALVLRGTMQDSSFVFFRKMR